MNRNILFCRTGYMVEYRGQANGETIINGGLYVKKNKTGEEINNFKAENDGYTYAFFETQHKNGKPMQVHLEKIDTRFTNADFAKNLTVVMCATPKKGGTCIVGLYKNATVYRNLQKYNSRYYNIKVKSENVFLISEEQRFFVINKQNCGFAFGRSNIRYVKFCPDKLFDYINNILSNTNFIPYDSDLSKYYEENGKPIKMTVNRYERNPQAREEYLKKHGTKCEICGFDAEEIYGTEYKGKIEVHHKVPISKRGSDYKLNIDNDLIAVCPNCHMILHTKVHGKEKEVEEIKKCVRQSFGKTD